LLGLVGFGGKRSWRGFDQRGRGHRIAHDLAGVGADRDLHVSGL